VDPKIITGRQPDDKSEIEIEQGKRNVGRFFFDNIFNIVMVMIVINMVAGNLDLKNQANC